MSYFPSLPGDAGVRDILKANPTAGLALVEFHSAVLRADTQLTAKEKELIAAYVSGLNGCQYCYGVHAETAKAFGVAEELLTSLLTDFDNAPVDPRLKPLLVYAKILTLTPTKVQQSHVDAVLARGWTESDLTDAVLTICLFNFMNRLVDGHGVKGSQTLFEEPGRALHAHGYNPIIAFIKPPVTGA